MIYTVVNGVVFAYNDNGTVPDPQPRSASLAPSAITATTTHLYYSRAISRRALIDSLLLPTLVASNAPQLTVASRDFPTGGLTTIGAGTLMVADRVGGLSLVSIATGTSAGRPDVPALMSCTGVAASNDRIWRLTRDGAIQALDHDFARVAADDLVLPAPAATQHYSGLAWTGSQLLTLRSDTTGVDRLIAVTP